eukprot:2582851-Rhodomonas_salina.1
MPQYQQASTAGHLAIFRRSVWFAQATASRTLALRSIAPVPAVPTVCGCGSRGCGGCTATT